MAETDHGKGLFKVMTIGTAISFGALAAIVVSMKDFLGGDAEFHFSYRTIVAFVIGAAIGWGFWWIIGRLRSPG